MMCPKCKTKMEFIGFIERGYDQPEHTLNWYCDKCDIIYYKFGTKEVNI